MRTTPLAIALVSALALGVLAAGCGGDDGGGDIDAAPTPIDAAAPDAADRCAALCGCAAEYCQADQATCLADCEALPISVVECRIEHCAYAQSNPTLHCPHALGDPDSQGIPPACIAP